MTDIEKKLLKSKIMTDIEKKLIAIKEDLRGYGLNEAQINKISDSIIELSQDVVRFVGQTM